LRCLVREKLIDFLQKNYPGSLPRYRGELDARAAQEKGSRDLGVGDPSISLRTGSGAEEMRKSA
jgi:hypothetical protein